MPMPYRSVRNYTNEGSEIDMIGLCIAFEPDIRFVLFDIEMPDNYSLEMLSSIKCKSSA